MKIVIPVTVDTTVDIEIGLDEIREALLDIEPIERARQALVLLNDHAKLVRSIDDSLIAQMTLPQRQAVLNFFQAQIVRFDAPAREMLK